MDDATDHIISSQRHLDDATVAEKRAAKDYVVTISPPFDVDGETYRTLIDGHHSLAAARADGAEPVYIVADVLDNDRLGLLARGDVEGYLEVSRVDSDWYDIADGEDVW